jgi:hypothetical protein
MVEKIINFGDIVKELTPPPLKDLVGREVVLSEVYFGTNDYGQEVVYVVIEGMRYFSNSKVIKQQAELIIEYLNKNKEIDGIKVKIVPKNNYYMFQ